MRKAVAPEVPYHPIAGLLARDEEEKKERGGRSRNLAITTSNRAKQTRDASRADEDKAAPQESTPCEKQEHANLDVFVLFDSRATNFYLQQFFLLPSVGFFLGLIRFLHVLFTFCLMIGL